MGSARQVTVEDWENELKTHEGLVVLDFGATWCGPCNQLAPHFDKIAEEYEGRAIVGKVDVDQAQTVAAEFAISSVPSTVLIRKGQRIDTIVGVFPDKIRAAIDQNL